MGKRKSGQTNHVQEQCDVWLTATDKPKKKQRILSFHPVNIIGSSPLTFDPLQSSSNKTKQSKLMSYFKPKTITQQEKTKTCTEKENTKNPYHQVHNKSNNRPHVHHWSSSPPGATLKSSARQAGNPGNTPAERTMQYGNIPGNNVRTFGNRNNSSPVPSALFQSKQHPAAIEIDSQFNLSQNDTNSLLSQSQTVHFDEKSPNTFDNEVSFSTPFSDQLSLTFDSQCSAPVVHVRDIDTCSFEDESVPTVSKEDLDLFTVFEESKLTETNCSVCSEQCSLDHANHRLEDCTCSFGNSEQNSGYELSPLNTQKLQTSLDLASKSKFGSKKQLADCSHPHVNSLVNLGSELSPINTQKLETSLKSGSKSKFASNFNKRLDDLSGFSRLAFHRNQSKGNSQVLQSKEVKHTEVKDQIYSSNLSETNDSEISKASTQNSDVFTDERGISCLWKKNPRRKSCPLDFDEDKPSEKPLFEKFQNDSKKLINLCGDSSKRDMSQTRMTSDNGKDLTSTLEVEQKESLSSGEKFSLSQCSEFKENSDTPCVQMSLNSDSFPSQDLGYDVFEESRNSFDGNLELPESIDTRNSGKLKSAVKSSEDFLDSDFDTLNEVDGFTACTRLNPPIIGNDSESGKTSQMLTANSESTRQPVNIDDSELTPFSQKLPSTPKQSLQSNTPSFDTFPQMATLTEFDSQQLGTKDIDDESQSQFVSLNGSELLPESDSLKVMLEGQGPDLDSTDDLLATGTCDFGENGSLLGNGTVVSDDDDDDNDSQDCESILSPQFTQDSIGIYRLK